MSEVKWIKLVTDIFDDEKIQMIEGLPSADSVIVIWFKLLCLAGKTNNDGVFIMNNRIAYTDEMFSVIFRRDINTVRMALSIFERYGMIEIIDNVVTIPNWNKHQTLDAYEKKKARDRLYQQKRRENQKLLVENRLTSDEVSDEQSSCVAISDIDKDIDKDKEKEIVKEKEEGNRKRFQPPTVQEVQDYIEKQGYKTVSAQRFVDFYESKGWYVGKNKMKDWHRALSGWESRANDKKPTNNQFNQMEQKSSYDMNALEKMLLGG